MPSCGSPTPSWSGWLEGLFHGIQATLVAQQVAARAQLDEMRQRSLPQGADPSIGPSGHLPLIRRRRRPTCRPVPTDAFAPGPRPGAIVGITLL